jgi:protein-disulfide isomerase
MRPTDDGKDPKRDDTSKGGGSNTSATASEKSVASAKKGTNNEVSKGAADPKSENVKPTDEIKKPAVALTAPPAKSRIVKFLDGKLPIDMYKHPVIGSPEAPHVVVELMSYDCSHCRQMNPIIKEAVKRYGNQVAVVVLPIPLDRECNKYRDNINPGACVAARLACAVAQLDPYEFPKFHEFMMSGKERPTADKIIPKAYTLVNRDKLREIKDSPEIKKQVERYVELLGKFQGKELPIQIFGNKTMTGAVEKKEDVFKTWEENLGVKPQ